MVAGDTLEVADLFTYRRTWQPNSNQWIIRTIQKPDCCGQILQVSPIWLLWTIAFGPPRLSRTPTCNCMTCTLTSVRRGRLVIDDLSKRPDCPDTVHNYVVLQQDRQSQQHGNQKKNGDVRILLQSAARIDLFRTRCLSSGRREPSESLEYRSEQGLRKMWKDQVTDIII